MKPEDAFTKSIEIAQAMRSAPNAAVAAAPSLHAALGPSSRPATAPVVIARLPQFLPASSASSAAQKAQVGLEDACVAQSARHRAEQLVEVLHFRDKGADVVVSAGLSRGAGEP